MAQKPKPNFKSNNQKKSGPQKDVLSGVTPAKRQTNKTHHDSLKGNRGNR
jgi:hypothetical protein